MIICSCSNISDKNLKDLLESKEICKIFQITNRCNTCCKLIKEKIIELNIKKEQVN